MKVDVFVNLVEVISQNSHIVRTSTLDPVHHLNHRERCSIGGRVQLSALVSPTRPQGGEYADQREDSCDAGCQKWCPRPSRLRRFRSKHDYARCALIGGRQLDSIRGGRTIGI
jgi:hypothetical protein